MGFNAYVNFGDIKGESTDKDHKDWVVITSYKQSVTQAVAAHQAGVARVGKATFSEFAIVKRLDVASPKLFEAACQGTDLKEVTIELVHASGNAPYLQIKLSDVVITGVFDDAEATGNAQYPTETVNMSYGVIQITYTRQKADGTAAGNVAAKWNVTKGAVA